MQWPPRPLVIVVLAAILVAVAIGVAVRGGIQPAAATRPAAGVTQRPPALPHARQRALDELPKVPMTAPGDASLPASLRDTQIDGWIGVDDDGHLVVTPGARWFFDYFLSATGEETPDDIRARIVSEIERRLPAVGAGEAVALLDRYLAYRERVRTAQASGPGDDLRRRLDQLHQLRIDTFGEADAAILFGEEEQAQAVDLRRRAVLSDTTLAPEEREHALNAIEQQLPAAVREARAETFAPLRLMQDEQALRNAGGSPEDVHMLRQQRVGTEAAARLAALDRERGEWQQRIADYRRARQLIEADARIGESGRAQGIEALIAQRFTEQERVRVEALDRPQ